ncbi:uncharacterized protein LOC120350563 [Nilaparvata lugens]|uniref:uncharacterized protein LOC120350563 n=1 Tax=Nilaparvata lugens TaxID=108931 RepID=UPI00193D21C8|nr:uncharacterized protein LOC120350563 [Nilaparvata lugens]
MVRERKLPKSKGLFDAEQMKEGVKLVLEGQSLRAAANQMGLKFQTFARYVRKIKNNQETDMKARCDERKIFTDQQEKDLATFLVESAKMFYGLSTQEARKLAWEMADRNEIQCPVSREQKKMAGKDWLYEFMKHHPNLLLRAPDGCSHARAMGFNKYNVRMFFENYETILSNYPELQDPSRIWNLHETKTETNQRPSRVIAQKGIKQVSKALSGERGTLVTTALIINAAGNTMPSVMVFPRVHFKNHMIAGAPSGTLGLANQTGWMTSSNFVYVIEHFIKFSGCSKSRQMLLICDNHESHLSIEAITLAKSNGLHILTLHPHCTHMMQPLDVGLMQPFQTF